MFVPCVPDTAWLANCRSWSVPLNILKNTCKHNCQDVFFLSLFHLFNELINESGIVLLITRALFPTIRNDYFISLIYRKICMRHFDNDHNRKLLNMKISVEWRECTIVKFVMYQKVQRMHTNHMVEFAGKRRYRKCYVQLALR